jgi:hypothetical protein
MIEKVYFIYSEQGFIGTVTWLEVIDKIFALVDIYGIFVDGKNIYLDTEIHYKDGFFKPLAEDEVINTALSRIIPGYDHRVYLWSCIETNQYNPHRRQE